MIMTSSMLCLRPILNADKAFFVRLYTDTDVMKFIDHRFDQQQIEKIFSKVVSIGNKYCFYVIEKTKQTQLVGVIGLIADTDLPNCYQLGVMINPAHQNVGHAYKATKMLIEHAFGQTQAHIIWVSCHKDNAAANRIARALGFVEQSDWLSSEKKNNNIRWEMTFEQFQTAKR